MKIFFQIITLTFLSFYVFSETFEKNQENVDCHNTERENLHRKVQERMKPLEDITSKVNEKDSKNNILTIQEKIISELRDLERKLINTKDPREVNLLSHRYLKKNSGY